MDYKVTDTQLTGIANAIRAKTGKSSQIEFPAEFVSEIGSISGGGGNVQMSSGTFTTSSEQYGIVSVNCGFEPDLVLVILPFSNGDTFSLWWKDIDWANTKSFWSVAPVEWRVVFLEDLGATARESGIQNINSNGFSFICNAENTRNVTCEYIAFKYSSE